MYKSIQITNQAVTGTDYLYTWEEAVLTVRHSFGNAYFAMLTNEERNVVSYPMTVKTDELIVAFPAALGDGELFYCDLFSSNGTVVDDAPAGLYYSGTVENVMLLCKSLNISEDRLATVDAQKVEEYQKLVNDAVDGYLGEYYFTPITAYNQVQPNGAVKKVFPGKLRLLARQWVVGLMMQSEFQNLEPNMNRQGRNFVEAAMREMRQLASFRMRLPGQRNKSALSRTFPPNMQPPRQIGAKL